MIWLQLCLVYLKIGILGFGGGYAMLSLIQADVVERYGWISSQEFTDIVEDAILRGEEHLLPGLGVFLEKWWTMASAQEQQAFSEKLAQGFTA